jgi:hypothetical protein
MTALDHSLPLRAQLALSPLGAALALCVVMVPLTLALLLVDTRVLDSEAIWLKPLKFQLSLGLHAATVLLLTAHLPGMLAQTRTVRWVNAALGWTLIYEALFIALQAARGVRSHFNSATWFDEIGGTIMAGGAGVLTLAPAVVGVVLIWHLVRRGSDRLPLHLGMALGLILSGWLGGQTGGAIGANQGPFVGAALGPFLPLTGWSLTGGDLRIAHFAGLHAMQALPVGALVASVILPRHLAVAAVVAGSTGWAVATLWLLYMAQSGLPPF